MSTDFPDEQEHIESARREAAARAKGAKNRYLINTGDVIDVASRQRMKMNFWKNRTVRLTLAGTAFGLVAATAIVDNRHVIAQGVIELAKSMAPAQETPGQIAAPTPVTPVPVGHANTQTPELVTPQTLAQMEGAAQGDQEGSTTAGPEAAPAQAPESEPDDDSAHNVATLAVASSAPTPTVTSAPAAAPATPAPQVPPTRASTGPSESKMVPSEVASAARSVKPVVLMPLPIEAPPSARVVQPPKLAVGPAPKASPLPRNLTSDAQTTRVEPEQVEPAVSPELVAAVNSARSKVDPATDAKQPVKSVNGVFVDLPAKKVAKATAGPAATSQAKTSTDAKEVTAPVSRPFSVVSHFTGGLLVRAGQQVTHVRIGEVLPNGKRLVSVNESTGAYMAE